ncbi:hypothetical protein BRC83_06150 [Halobacteriales archaeon QS_1_68_17]|nr:MAG: hypothetical protein BRC83_06150 [Halobacteriales archaeon QS_1_68_17]
MSILVWLVLGVVVLLVVEVLIVYRGPDRDTRGNERAYLHRPEKWEADTEEADPNPEQARTCPECGTDNDATFDYCRNCAADMTGSRRTRFLRPG